MAEPRGITVRLDGHGALLGVDVAGSTEQPILVETVRSRPIAPFLLDEFKEGGSCWVPNAGG